MELLASDTSSFEGGPPFSAEPHGWGISMSVSGEFQRARSTDAGLHDHPARRWEPKRLRLRLFSIAARITGHARQTHLRYSAHTPWAALLLTALARLHPA